MQRKTVLLFETKVLNKYDIKYFKCLHCEFIQTEEPFWLNEAYNSPIGLIDVGLLQRNIFLANETSRILEIILPGEGTYVDYGGGYGTFVRLMRDKGFDFYLMEKYAQNIFAKFFELDNAKTNGAFTCLTAFEVFEHLQNPLEVVAQMFSLSDTIIFSTELQPAEINSPSDWWYFVPEGGQHISLYSFDSLVKLKEHFNCYLYSDKANIHILSKIALKDPFVSTVAKPSIAKRIKNKLFYSSATTGTIKRESLLMKDFEFYKNKISNGSL